MPVARIAAAVGTPFYCYSAAALERQIPALRRGLRAGATPLICYAVKANSNLAVLRLFARLGAGADVVSEGELRRALAAGIPPQRIIFSGVGKTAAELAFALGADIHQINVESVPELDALSRVATRAGRTAPVAIRVNPDVDARTHAKIATGKKENKFGIDLAQAADGLSARRANCPASSRSGWRCISARRLDRARAVRDRLRAARRAGRALRADGLAVQRLDLGGGLGIRYRDEAPPRLEDYAGAGARRVRARSMSSLAFEPGRCLVGTAGVLVARVLYVKDGVTPALRHRRRGDERPDPPGALRGLARHRAGATRRPRRRAWRPPTSSGRSARPATPSPATATCRRSPRAIWSRSLTAGAYGAVMSSSYNSRLLVPEVLVDGRPRSPSSGRGRATRRCSALDTVPRLARRSAEGAARRACASEAPHDRSPRPDLARRRRLALALRLARAALLWERVWPAAVAGVVRRSASLPCLALFDVLPLLPGPAHAGVLAFFALALAGAVVVGIAPAGSALGPIAIRPRRRIETASGLPHRPLAALDDRPERAARRRKPRRCGQAHQRRDGGGDAAAAGRLAGSGAGAPRPLGAARRCWRSCCCSARSTPAAIGATG